MKFGVVEAREKPEAPRLRGGRRCIGQSLP